MSIELFDEVDENDNPTGKKVNKKQAHEQGHIHRVAAVLVFMPNGKLLVQKHKNYNRRLDHSVGGHVSAGEKYKEAAKREVYEEIGLRSSIKNVGVVLPGNDHFTQHDSVLRHNYGVFIAKAPIGWKFIANEEVDQIVEMELDEVVRLMNENPDKFVKGFLISLARYLKYIKSPLKINAYGKNWGEL